MVGALLALPEIFPPHLAGDDVLRTELIRWYGELEKHGVEATIGGLGR